MTDYIAHIGKHRRLAILRLLADSPEYVSNSSVIDGVVNGLGLTSTYDQIMSDLGWLREQGFVTFDPDAAFVVVTGTQRGIEVARGLISHPGIQRPRPRF